MSPSSYLLVLLFLVTEAGAAVAQTSISGRLGESLCNRELYLLRYDDLLSEHWEVADQTSVGDDGNFAFDLTIETTEIVMLRTGSYFARFFLEPDQNYTLQIDLPEAPLAQTFSAIPLELKFGSLEEEDINSLLPQLMNDIRAVQDESFFDLIKYMGKGAGAWRRINADELAEANIITEEGDTIVQSSSLDSLHLRVDQLKRDWQLKLDGSDQNISRTLLAVIGVLEAKSGIPLQQIYAEHFDPADNILNEPLRESLFYDLVTMSVGREELSDDHYTQALATADKDMVVKYFKEDLPFLHTRHVTAALLVLIKHQWQKAPRSHRGSIRILDELATSEELDPVFRDVAISLREELTVGSTLRDEFLPEITLLDHKGDRFDLVSLKGQLVYLSVVNINSLSCQRELAVLENLSRKYGRQIQMVTLCMDTSADELRNYLARHPKQDWTFLLGSGHPVIRHDLMLYSVPDFFLIEPSGKLHDDHTQSPGEGVELLFQQVLR